MEEKRDVGKEGQRHCSSVTGRKELCAPLAQAAGLPPGEAIALCSANF